MKAKIFKSDGHWIAMHDLAVGVGMNPVHAWLLMVGNIALNPSILAMVGDPMKPCTWRFAIFKETV